MSQQKNSSNLEKDVVNNITLSASPVLSIPKNSETKSELLINPQPLNLIVDTPTDWPTVLATGLVGIGSIITSAILARITYINQRNQIRANTATFRQQWLQELREATSEFLAAAASVKIESIKKETSNNESEIDVQHYIKIIRLKSKIYLMLDKTKDYAEKVENALEQVIENIDGNDGKLESSILKLQDIMRDVLEKAWTDIKNDLKGKLTSSPS